MCKMTGLGHHRTKSNNAEHKTFGGYVSALYIDADINDKAMPDLNNPNLELVSGLK